MILEADEWHLAYSQILADCRDEEGASVLLLANADVDSIAAARVWSYMLRADGIPYQLLPCRSWSALQRMTTANAKHQQQQVVVTESVRAIVLLNLGASRNLTRLFATTAASMEETAEPDDENGAAAGLDANKVKLYVTDCRRPVHLANVHADKNVVIFWDAVAQNKDDLPSDGDNLSGNESSTDEEEEEEDDDEDDSLLQDAEDDLDEGEHEFDAGDNHVQPPNPQEDDHMNVEQQGADYDGDQDNDDDEESVARIQKRRSDLTEQSTMDTDDDPGKDMEEDPAADQDKDTASPTAFTADATLPSMTPRELHHERRNRLRAYYSSGSFFGAPAAFVAYQVATMLRFGNLGDLLWLACVGVTDAYLHARLDVVGYTELTVDLKRHVERLFPNTMVHRVERTVYAEHLIGRTDNNSQQQPQTKIGFSENGRILCEADFRFFLLRHSSLFDAMVYSDFLSTRMQLSTSRGMHKLQELLAKMGFPLQECRQPFAFMKPSLRRRLQAQIQQHAEEYGLEHFEFTSFFRVTGYQSLLSASDTSYAVTALLEYAPRSTTSANATDEQQEEEELLQAFNCAYDALNSNAAPTVSLNGLTGEGSSLTNLVNGGRLSGSTGLGAGIRLAMALQRNIMSTAASLIDRNAITRLSHFRYAYITCSSQAESNGPGNMGYTSSGYQSYGTVDDERNHVFAKPLALTRLAHYLMDLHRENGKWTGTKARPLILMAEKPRNNSFVVVGYEYPESAGNFTRNRFGKNFELAAQSMNGTFRFDSFDSNVVEVAAGDVQRFIEQLHYLLDSM